MDYKYEQDRAVLRSLDKPPAMNNKRLTKGQFQINVTTNAGNWLKDRTWQFKANDLYKSLELQREAVEMKLLQAKKHQKRVQYMALENQYKLHVKKR